MCRPPTGFAPTRLAVLHKFAGFDSSCHINKMTKTTTNQNPPNPIADLVSSVSKNGTLYRQGMPALPHIHDLKF